MITSYYTFSYRASRLGREHHDDLAQFMLGMGYATEALHLPGISKRCVVLYAYSQELAILIDLYDMSLLMVVVYVFQVGV